MNFSIPPWIYSTWRQGVTTWVRWNFTPLRPTCIVAPAITVVKLTTKILLIVSFQWINVDLFFPEVLLILLILGKLSESQSNSRGLTLVEIESKSNFSNKFVLQRKFSRLQPPVDRRSELGLKLNFCNLSKCNFSITSGDCIIGWVREKSSFRMKLKNRIFSFFRLRRIWLETSENESIVHQAVEFVSSNLPCNVPSFLVSLRFY